MNFADIETIADFLEENEAELATFLDGDEAQAARLIADFQTFTFDAMNAEDYLWEPADEDNNE